MAAPVATRPGQAAITPVPTRRRRTSPAHRGRWVIYLMLVPGLIQLVLFKLAPVGALAIAFQEYSPFLGIFQSPWVGLEQFARFLDDPDLGRLVRNTVALSLGTLLVSFPVPILFALLLNEVRLRFLHRFTQTLTFVPYFISSAVLVSIVYSLLSPQGGLVNEVITALGGTPVYFMTEPAWFRPIYIGMSTWQTFGYSAIIYTAALSNIDPTLYEAAEMDGAGRWRKMWHITLPALRPMIIVLWILAVGQVLTVDLDKILLMYNPSVYSTADVVQSFVFRQAFASEGFPNYSYAAAVGLIQGVLALVLIMSTNRVAKRLEGSGLF